MMMIRQKEEGFCIITGLPTYYKYDGDYILETFLTSANKMQAKYPHLTFEKCLMEIIASMIVDKITSDKKETSWNKLKTKIKSKLPSFFKN